MNYCLISPTDILGTYGLRMAACVVDLLSVPIIYCKTFLYKNEAQESGTSIKIGANTGISAFKKTCLI